MATTGSTPEEGWYPDPSGSGRRWWDGEGWTQHYQSDAEDDFLSGSTMAPGPANAQPLPGANITGPDAAIDPAAVAAAGGGLILLLSLFAPWVGAPNGAFNAFTGELPWPLTGGDFEVDAGEVVSGSITSGFPHGWIFLLLALGGLGVAYAHFTGAEWTGNALLGIGGFTVILALIDSFVLRSSKLGALTADIGPAWGVLVAILAGVLTAAAGALILARDMQR